MQYKISITNLLVVGIIALTLFFYLHDISRNMVFIGDQAWFYISARNLILTGNIPLLGIESSHPWLHQGPLWTYVLSLSLILFNFNPVGGAYLTSVFGLISALLIYFVGSSVFSKRFGLISLVLYSFSPLVIFHIRMPYHTSPIPLFVLLLMFAFIKWIKGNVYYFPIAIFLMSVLYNLELATVIFWPIILLYLAVGFYKKKSYFKKLLNKKMVILSFIGFVIPMIPVLIYDIQNGFSQTVVFAGWFFYKALQMIGVFEKSMVDQSSFTSAFTFFFSKYELLTISLGKTFSYLIFFSSLALSIYYLKTKSFFNSFSMVLALTLVGLLAYFISGIPSEAYMIMLFPGLIFIFSYLIYQIRNKYILSLVLIFISFLNIKLLIESDYLTNDLVVLSEKIKATDEIISISGGREVDLTYKGVGQEFRSSVMPYEYLILWRQRDTKEEKVRVLVEEKENNIIIKTINE